MIMVFLEHHVSVGEKVAIRTSVSWKIDGYREDGKEEGWNRL